MGVQAHKHRSVRRWIGAFILIVAVINRSTLYAQLPARSVTTAAAVESGAAPVEQTPDSVRLLVGRSTIVDFGKPIARVSLTSADIADALVTSPNELLINAKMPGTISMFVWDRGGTVRRYEIVVQRDLLRLSAQLKELFPKESIDVRSNGKTVVLSGSVSSKDVADKMASLAGSFADTKEELVSLLQIGEAGRSNQVLLRVRFAEVNRTAMTELGIGLFTSATGIKNQIGSITTGQFPSVGFDALSATKSSSSFGSDVTTASGKLTFSDFLNLFLFNEKFDLGAMVRALQTKGLFQSLAEPNLIAESGKEASFLAGGEFPIPVAQASGGGTSISVTFKEYGIRLTFTPVVIGNRVHLKVKPEVSALDFSNAVTLGGFRIPALTTRRTETEVELNDGQTFAIAGLLNNTMTSTMQKIPGIGDIPILGLLFKSKAAQKSQTELVVMITPEILANNSPGVTPTLPRLDEPFLPSSPQQKKPVDPPAPAFRPSSTGRTEIAAPANVTTTATAPAAKAPTSQAAVSVLTATSSAKRGPNVHVDAAAATPPPAATAPVAATPVAASPVAPRTSAPTAARAADPDAPKPLTAREQKAQKQEEEAANRARNAEARRFAAQTLENQRKQKIEDERQAVRDREQALKDREQAARDAEAASRALQASRRQAARDAEIAKKQAAKDAEAAKRQAEVDAKRQKTLAEAEIRYKAAEAAYQAELAKKETRTN